MPHLPHILLVDDEPLLLQSCKLLLEVAGFAVSTATTGREALALLTSDEPSPSIDLMLLDLNMPDMGGLDVLRELRNRNLEICTVVLSAEVGFESVRQSFQLGAYDYVRKPYEFDELVNKLKSTLQKREMEVSFSHLRKQLERSERLHRFMIESSPDIIFIVDRDGNFRFVNDRVQDLLAYGKEELLGQHYSIIVAPESLDKAAVCFSERRSELRGSKDEELWLLCRPPARAGEERRRIAFELNAMGIYENDNGETGQPQFRDYSGTYIVARDITERLAAQRMIHYQAYHDLLTGLPNRALFMDRLGNAISSARRTQQKLVVMFLDLDRFKLVNDTLGHDIGDELLKEVASRLKKCLRESDTLARLGGDEFIALLTLIDSTNTANKVAGKIVEAIKQPINIGPHEIYVTASVGIAMYPDDGRNADDLIKNADVAMYHTKASGKDGFRIYTQELSELQEHQLSVEQEIRRGLREKQFVVYYQPQLHAMTGIVTGVEALLRWQHPEKGLLTPAYFLPVAEESSLMLELGEFVLGTALDDVKRWWSHGITLDKLAINCSVRQIEQKDFVDKFIGQLKQRNFPGHALEIEITESTLMNEIENTIGKLKQLAKYGVNVAIDDFGTGYSSLSLLQKLPIHRLKIDRSFIQDLQVDSERFIIEAIAHMARGLNLEMVAEGVEEDYQLKYLKNLQCQVVQGYLVGPVMPAAELEQFLLQHNNIAPVNPALRPAINS
ncbi:MAG TPA: EAL domain-containing protein [Candidatus Acidoferrum sp.]|nr:EAL domain-containing protein [Candidatus Acidoferrum sp.]